MSSKTLILITFFLLSAFAVRSQFIPDVHTILAWHGLPPGLLPDTAGNYSLKPSGELEVEISNGPCTVFHPSVTLRYEKTVSGKISFAKWVEVKGILVQRSGEWFTVHGIHRLETAIILLLRGDMEMLPVCLLVQEFRKIPPCTKPIPALKDPGVSGEEYKPRVAVA